MKIIHMGIGEITPADYNPRRELKPGEPEFERIRRSIKEFGLVEPLVWNKRTKTLVGGHQRLAVLKHIGADSVDVTVVDLPLAREKALNAALNRITGVWDNDKLREVIASLSEADISLMGFDDGELAKLVDYKGAAGKTKPDDTPEPPAAKDTIARAGDLWILGEHRLLCGDSTIAATYDTLLQGEKAAMVATDPPYMVDYTGERPNAKGGKWKDTKWDTSAAPQVFFDAWVGAALQHARDNAAWYCWHASVNGHLPVNAFKKHGLLVHQQIVWVKPAPMLGYSFFPWAHEPAWLAWAHEPAFFGWKKGHKPPRDGDFTHALSTVWKLDYDGKARQVDAEHPTQKPVEIFAIPMRKHTQRGDICLEPFSGSGSQIIAGERLGRRVFAIEQSPQFVDVAVKRWEKFTGKKAERRAAPRAAKARA